MYAYNWILFSHERESSAIFLITVNVVFSNCIMLQQHSCIWVHYVQLNRSNAERQNLYMWNQKNSKQTNKILITHKKITMWWWMLIRFTVVINSQYIHISGLPGSCSDKESTCRRCKRPRFYPCIEKILWRRKWQPASVVLPGKFHGQRNLMG